MKKILIVEDDYINVVVYKGMLRFYDLTFVSNYKELNMVLKSFNPELIILDIMLPEKSGFEIAEELSKEDKFKDIPIIFATAKNDPKDIAQGLKIGAYDYITKPINEDILLARIESTLSKKNKEKKLYNDSIIDPLTDINNRRYFEERFLIHLEYAKREDKNFAIAMVDIDFFKNINDQYGHMAGDQILREFSIKLRSIIRPYDLIARYGGEEFILLFVECDKVVSYSIMERFRKRIVEEMFVYDKEKIKISFSCGIAEYFEVQENKKNYNKETVEQLIKVADERLFKAKRSGRNKVVIKRIE